MAASLSLLAGCSSPADTGPGEPSPGPEPTTPAATAEPSRTPTATVEPTPDPAAQTRLDVARESIETAVAGLSSELEKLEESLEFVDFHTREITAHLDGGEDQLDAAESTATGEQIRVVESLRAVIAWGRPVTGAVAAYSDALDAMETGGTYSGNQRFRDAADQFGTSVDLLDEADEHLARAGTAFDAIDVTPLGGDEADLVQGRDIMDSLDEAVVGMRYYAWVSEDFTAGTGFLSDGFDAYQEGNYADATVLFDDAHEVYDTAYATAQEGEDAATTWLLETMIRFTCQTESYRDAAEHMKAAAQAGETGDSSGARAAMDAAEEAIARCF